MIWVTRQLRNMRRNPSKTVNTCLIAVFIGIPSARAKCWASDKNAVIPRPELGREAGHASGIAATRVDRDCRDPPSRPRAGSGRGRRRRTKVAERVGFEPTVRLPVRRISSAVLSTTQPPLRFDEVRAGRKAGAARSRRASSSDPTPCLGLVST